MPAQKDEAVTIHTLLTREIRPIANWHEWLKQWQAADNIQWMEGLLHVGFSVPLERRQYGEKEYDEIDRILFYFIIADGWADDYLLELPTDGSTEYIVGYDSNWNQIRKKPRELRQQLARKAFDMLCPNFFKVELMGGGRHGDEFSEVWEGWVVTERCFPVIQNFFRAEKERYGDDMRIRNLSRGRNERSHNEQLAVAFFLNLARFLWKWKELDLQWYYSNKEERANRDAKMRARVDPAKPWMVEILADINRLDVLREWIFILDKPCLAKLKEIALRNKLKSWPYPVGKDRLVATLDEACFIGSKAAWFLKEYELKMREHKRLKAIREAEQAREEADRQIEKLTAKK